MTINQEQIKKIGKFWDKIAEEKPKSDKVTRFFKMLAAEKRLPVRGWLRSVIRSRGANTTGWWNNPFVVRKVNARICGREIDGRSAGLIEWLKDTYAPLFPLGKGISVGCGDGSKEIRFMRAGIVASFDLYEFSEKCVEKGGLLARQLGLADRTNFRLGDALEEIKSPEGYDFVVWNDALHHMPDVSAALAWSRRILKPGGIFALDDFVGATRWQWPDRQLALATAVRAALPLRYRALPSSPFRYPPSKLERPTVAYMLEKDPSEAADSDAILPALSKYFPEATVRKTGGVVYHLALHELLHNFDPREDRPLLELLLLIDELCIATGDTHYAAAIGKKS